MKNLRAIILLLLAMLLFAACSPDMLGSLGAEPVPGAGGEGAESPLSVLPTPAPVPTFDRASVEISAEAGVLTGVLRVRRGTQYVPVSEVKLGLGELLLDDEGNLRQVGYDASTMPTTMTDENGRFVFADVTPGRYAFVLDIVMSQFLLFDQTTGIARIAEVNAGELTDIGVWDYEELPLPQFSTE